MSCRVWMWKNVEGNKSVKGEVVNPMFVFSFQKHILSGERECVWERERERVESEWKEGGTAERERERGDIVERGGTEKREYSEFHGIRS
jgi:hypothetical protein